MAAVKNDSALKNILQGKSRAPRIDTLSKLARELDIPMPEVEAALNQELLPESNASLAVEVVPPETRLPVGPEVPVYGRAEGGEDGFFEVNLADAPLEYVERPAALASVKRLFAILVHGSSMEPVWVAGDVVYITPDRPVRLGDYVMVTLERGPGQQPAALLKRYVSQDDDRLILEQHNPYKQMSVPRRQVREFWRALHWRELR
ncbi:S24 family peptidase [Roseomonas gilardii]|uniref:S24 family peptidase n=1 Tax=Roseomonas gilardii TaxID=257708 RepID=A0ABU3MK23_9PROT|nr:S24 family peptidase [Roseomonas gilardii]MDT8333020.1 S24 family peptidase [Roseomonas gilardii]